VNSQPQLKQLTLVELGQRFLQFASSYQWMGFVIVSSVKVLNSSSTLQIWVWLMMELEACDCKCSITFIICMLNCCSSNKSKISRDICVLMAHIVALSPTSNTTRCYMAVQYILMYKVPWFRIKREIVAQAARIIMSFVWNQCITIIVPS